MEELVIAKEKFMPLDFAPVGICIIRSDYHVLFWNNCLEYWTNVPKEDILGRSIFEFFPNLNKDSYKIRFSSTFEGGPPSIFSAQLHKHLFPAVLPNGERQVQHCVSTAVPALVGAGHYALISVEDVTELTKNVATIRELHRTAVEELNQRKKIETELREAKQRAEVANHTKDAFLTNINHEFRTPMNAILGFSQMLLSYQTENLNQEQKNSLEMIYKSGERLLHLVNTILDISRIEAGKIKTHLMPFSLKQLVFDIEQMSKHLIYSEDVDFAIEFEAKLPDFFVSDVHKINKILLNLVANAVKLTPQGKIKLKIFQQNKYLCFTVSDDGLGIPSEEIDHIFDEFYQLSRSDSEKFGGNGLGLSLAKKLTDLLGGQLRAESNLNGGSTFTLMVPFKVASPNEKIENFFASLW